jgi:hypothetical protein
MSARAERRRAQRDANRSLEAEPKQGGVFGSLNDGRSWVVLFLSTDHAERFLQLLGPPPATETRLREALKEMACFHSLTLH